MQDAVHVYTDIMPTARVLNVSAMTIAACTITISDPDRGGSKTRSSIRSKIFEN